MSGLLRSLFLLEDDTVFLNHGSFGACPISVFEDYQKWQRQVEKQPVRFFVHELWPALDHARTILGEFIGTPKECLVPTTNATYGVNVIAHSIKLGEGDEVLSNEHEYGACTRAWNKVCGKVGANYVIAPIPDYIESLDQVAEAIWSKVTDRTKVLFISHITSPSGILFPVEELCRRAKERGILTVVDGAHCAGQITLNLAESSVDFYTGNCHKWLCAPKGSAFIYAKPDKKHLLEPLIVSWGAASEGAVGDPFLDELQWQGTNDPASFLAVPSAIQFQKDHDWDTVREECRNKICWIKDELEKLPNVKPWYPTTTDLHQQMAAVFITNQDPKTVKNYLMNEHRIEIPVGAYKGVTTMRVSAQGYTTQAELELLLGAIKTLG